jgi:hypothetical protein
MTLGTALNIIAFFQFQGFAFFVVVTFSAGRLIIRRVFLMGKLDNAFVMLFIYFVFHFDHVRCRCSGNGDRDKQDTHCNSGYEQ